MSIQKNIKSKSFTRCLLRMWWALRQALHTKPMFPKTKGLQISV